MAAVSFMRVFSKGWYPILGKRSLGEGGFVNQNEKLRAKKSCFYHKRLLCQSKEISAKVT